MSWRVSAVTLSMPGPSGGAGAREDDSAHQLRFLGRDDLGDEAAHRQAEQVDLFEAQGADEQHRVAGHRLDGVGGVSAGRADSAVVEGDHPAPGGESVDDAGVPVVQDRGQVVEQDQRYAVSFRAELPVGEVDAAHGHRSGRRVLV